MGEREVSAGGAASEPLPPAGHVTAAGADPDGAALRRILKGDARAFDELVDRHKQRLFRHIRRRVNDPHRAEDLTQEVFLRLFRAARAGAYSGEARVVTWLFAIAGNCVTDYLRAEGRRSAVTFGGGAEPIATADAPPDAAAAKEEDLNLRRLLEDLPEPQRAVVELHVLDGLTFGEVAELLGCPIPTAKSRLVYALRKLKRSLSEPRRQES